MLDPSVDEQLNRRGFAHVPGAVESRTCAALASMFDEDPLFRSTIDMARHRFGRGTYRYFAAPVPEIIARLQDHLYRSLVPVANDWADKLRSPHRYPPELDRFHAHCAANGQTEPTPLLLRYTAGGYNRLHQDRYGPVAFPLQATVLLSPTSAFGGGHFVLVENQPRQQSIAHVVDLDQGDLVIFPNQTRPTPSSRGYSRTTIRHGVTDVLRGERTTLGLIMHNAA